MIKVNQSPNQDHCPTFTLFGTYIMLGASVHEDQQINAEQKKWQPAQHKTCIKLAGKASSS